MITLLLTVFLVVLISAICSMTEAALYSVPWTYIENLRKQGSATGELLYQLRSRIDQPIAAVLTLNTVANTAGAAIAGAVAANVLGADNTALFAAGLTILILALGEILPKTLGVAHACGVASGMARPLRLMVLIFKPFIWFSSMLTRLVASPQSGPSATEDDIRAITSLSRQTGRIQQYEENAIRNILSLDVKHVREIMTPRTMVFSLQEDISVKDAYNHPQIWHYSRIPVYGDDNEDIVGIVLARTSGAMSLRGRGKRRCSISCSPSVSSLRTRRWTSCFWNFWNRGSIFSSCWTNTAGWLASYPSKTCLKRCSAGKSSTRPMPLPICAKPPASAAAP